MRAVLAALAILLCVLAGPVVAQDAGPIDYGAWNQVATETETALEEPVAETDRLDALRAEIARFRQLFLGAQETNASRIDTLRAQIDALGPPPAEGEPPEADEVAARRDELNRLLAEIEAPRRTAEEAYTRADGLIAEIDAVIRERQASRLLELGPSPLNPALWAGAISALGATVAEVTGETTGAWVDSERRSALRDNLPVLLVLGVLAVALVTRGRRIMVSLTDRALRRRRREGRDVLVFVVSLGQVILPVLGLLALAALIAVSGLAGPRGAQLAAILPVLGLSIFGARWLASWVFPASDAVTAPLDLPQDVRAEGRFYAVILGILMAIAQVILTVAEFDEHSVETITVLSFPLVLVSGFVLFRLGQFLGRAADALLRDDESSRLRSGVLRLGGRALAAVGIGGPLLAAVGYIAAAEALMLPTVQSLALLAFLAVLHEPIRDTYAILTNRDAEASRQALVPVLMSFLLTVASLPLFALIWGARVVDLQEIWARFREGITIGDTRISPENFLTFAVVFAIGYALTRLLQSTLRTQVLPKTRIDPGGRNAIVSGLGYVGIFLAALIAITTAGINLSSLAIVAGALSVGIGFGLQNIVSNFVSGIILLIERPISEGDWIEVGGQMGIVKDISVRSTRIETFDRTDVIVPNAEFVSGQVTNWTRGNLVGRVTISVGVAYSTDSRRVEEILLEICRAHPQVSMDPEPRVFFRRFGADALEFDCFCILRDVNFKLQVHSDLNHEIHRRFREEGIEIPFAQRDLWLRNPEALAGGAPSRGAPAGSAPAATRADDAFIEGDSE